MRFHTIEHEKWQFHFEPFKAERVMIKKKLKLKKNKMEEKNKSHNRYFRTVIINSPILHLLLSPE